MNAARDVQCFELKLRFSRLCGVNDDLNNLVFVVNFTKRQRNGGATITNMRMLNFLWFMQMS
ncbi:hypothetical protein D3C87_2181650 [compost metagenome]